MRYLHIGCGKLRYDGFINSDKDEMDISKPWPHEDYSVDGIVSMQVFQQLYWRDLVVALREAHRVLKGGGVMRFGTMLIENNDLNTILGWKNINLFSFDLLKRVLEEIGFSDVRIAKYHDSYDPLLVHVDNRPVGKGTSYVECIKI